MSHRDVAYELAKEYGLEIIKDSESAPEKSYSFVKCEEPKKIYVRDTIRSRFHLLSICHEIGHIELNHRKWYCLTDEDIERMRIEEGEKALQQKRLVAEAEAWFFAFYLWFSRYIHIPLYQEDITECVASYCTHLDKAYEDLDRKTKLDYGMGFFRRLFQQLKQHYPHLEKDFDNIIERALTEEDGSNKTEPKE